MPDTKINWADKVWNPTVGCTKVSAGCKFCYAERLHDQRHKAYLEGKKLPKQYAKPFEKMQFFADRLSYPLHLSKPKRIFVDSMSDLFHKEIPFGFIDSVYETMGYCQQHTFLVLTKRVDRAIEYHKNSEIFNAWSKWKNVWVGTSIEDQPTADERILKLLYNIPAAVRWLSIEPLLNNTDISGYLWPVRWHWDHKYNTPYEALAAGAYAEKLPQRFVETSFRFIDWVVVGCESGPKRRPCRIKWIENIVEQCKDANTPVWVKQMEVSGKVTDKIELFPEHLRIRELPEEKA